MERLVYKIAKVGSINDLKLINEKLNEPQNNQVTIAVKAIGLNFADVFCLQGLYQAAPRNNLIPGLEFSGEVIKKGVDVKQFNLGDKVIGITKFGAFTNYINLDQNYLLKLPDNWTLEEGASFIVQALTAYYAIKELGNLSNNQIVLIHSVAGGVGIYANRIAKKFNCTTIGTVGNENKISQIKDEQVDHILVRDKNFIKNLQNILGDNKIDLILEALTGKYFKLTFNLLVPQGRVVVYGATNFATHTSFPNYFQLIYKYLTRPKVDVLKLIEQNRSVMAFNLIWLYEKANYMKSLIDELIQLNLKKPKIGELFEFNNLLAAIKKFQSGRTIGKVVIRIPG
jgi:alcohol dehydrogenase